MRGGDGEVEMVGNEGYGGLGRNGKKGAIEGYW